MLTIVDSRILPPPLGSLQGAFTFVRLPLGYFPPCSCLAFNVTAGSTHPSFSDVFLIIPSFINRLIGLRTPPNRVFTHSLRAVLQFLKGASATQLSEAAKHHTLEDFVEDIAGTYDAQGNEVVIVETPIVEGITEQNGREVV